MALRAKLPRRHWIGYNDLLVSFGQNVCTPISPRCSACPVAPLCRKVNVTKAR
jgi:endonuclease-3